MSKTTTMNLTILRTKGTIRMTTQQLVPLADIERMASAMAGSRMFGVNTPDQAMALMLVAQSEGRHPASVAKDYHVVQGRPTLKADAILARFQEAGGTVEWTTYTNEKVEGRFSHPQGGSITIDWDMNRAKAAGLAAKDVWKQYPRSMLRARCISEAVRTIYPVVLGGMYTPEEVSDFRGVPPGHLPSEMAPETLAFHLANIAGCDTLDCLRDAFAKAYREAQDARDTQAIAAIVTAKDSRKAELTATPAIDGEYTAITTEE
jgi:hypothetical protein